jgi:hypothetical protein
VQDRAARSLGATARRIDFAVAHLDSMF